MRTDNLLREAAARRVRRYRRPRRLFLDKARVALEPGLRFGGEGSEHVRLNFATSAEILDDAVARMSDAVG